MYEYPKGSRWKQLKRYADLRDLNDEYHPDKILFCTDDYDDMDRSDTMPSGAALVMPCFELSFDRLHIDTTNGTIYLLNNNGSGQISFHSVKEIYVKRDVCNHPIIRIRCIWDTTQRTYHIGLLKGEIYK